MLCLLVGCSLMVQKVAVSKSAKIRWLKNSRCSHSSKWVSDSLQGQWHNSYGLRVGKPMGTRAEGAPAGCSFSLVFQLRLPFQKGAPFQHFFSQFGCGVLITMLSMNLWNQNYLGAPTTRAEGGWGWNFIKIMNIFGRRTRTLGYMCTFKFYRLHYNIATLMNLERSPLNRCGETYRFW